MHGLSTLNRLLGKKNKEVSRSTSNLNNLDTSSQHNKISPILNNAPFEQTFRVTVYLPKNQLYVERIGAKTKLKKLMADVCDSKNLNWEKFEFRHPTDMSQVFDTEQTIGEVGFNELRLVLKSKPRFNSDFHRFHSDDMMKYKSSNNAISVSSSDETSRNMKNVSKTSPYSSTNSLNSLDSTGMNSNNSNKNSQQPVAPMRKKKRPAPRPPSQSSISEQQEIFTTSTLNVFKEPHSILPKKNFHVSSPQLYGSNNVGSSAVKMSDSNNNIEMNSTNRLNAITRPTSLYVSTTTTTTTTTNGSGSDAEFSNEYHRQQRQRNNSESSEVQNILRDSSLSSGSMQNSLERRKKKSPAPVPPTRKIKPVPSPRTIVEDEFRPHSIAEIREVDDDEEEQYKEEEKLSQNSNCRIEEIPKLDKNANHQIDDKNANVSKVLLNNSTAVAAADVNANRNGVELADGPISIQIINETSTVEQSSSMNEIESRPNEIRSTSSDEEEEEVNIYNITTKSVVSAAVPLITKETSSTRQTVSVVQDNNVEVKEEIITTTTTTTTTVIEEDRQRSPSPTWTYTLPAPPVFADSTTLQREASLSPTDHRHNTTLSEFTAADNETIMSDSNTTTVSAETKIHPIILERRKTIEDSRYPAGIKDDESDKSAEVITSDLEDGYLGNNKVGAAATSVVALGNGAVNVISDSPTPGAETNRMEEREMIVDDFQRSRLIITRSDSFHSIGQQKKHGGRGGDDDFEIKRKNVSALPQRSTSFLSLKAEIAAANVAARYSNGSVPYSKQKSTSELSISDVPSLQSIEVIKNILNSSRKNSLQDPSTSALNEQVTSVPVAVEVKKQIEHHSPKVIVEENEKKKEVIRQLESQMSEPSPLREVKKATPAASESQWRYSGPPKINFSTWNERPKVEVAVMNDGDYIFGGQHTSNSSPRDSSTTSVLKRAEIFSSKPINTSTTLITTEKQHLPPKVLGVEYKKDLSNTSVINIKSRPISVDYSTSITNNNNNNISNKNTTVVTTTKQPINSANYPNSSTTQFVSYNRLSTNHKKFTPIVHGFKLDNGEQKSQQSSNTQINAVKLSSAVLASEPKRTEAPIIPLKPAFLRSTSAGDFNRKMKFSTAQTPSPTTVDVDSQHFSQTLRRTGELEKILHNDKRTDSIFGKVVDMDDESVKFKIRQSSIPAAPAPPPPAVALTFRKSAPAGDMLNDPRDRDQLLDAIKNFNKDSLRRK